jgi:hypothetical protein
MACPLPLPVVSDILETTDDDFDVPPAQSRSRISPCGFNPTVRYPLDTASSPGPGSTSRDTVRRLWFLLRVVVVAVAITVAVFDADLDAGATEGSTANEAVSGKWWSGRGSGSFHSGGMRVGSRRSPPLLLPPPLLS